MSEVDRNKRVVAVNNYGIVLNGYIVGTREIGGTNLVEMELLGTTSTVEVDDADFRWFSEDTEDYPFKDTRDNHTTQQLRKVDLAHDSSSIEPYTAPEPTAKIEEANALCSDVVVNYRGTWMKEPSIEPTNQHRFILDIDVPAMLIPSTKPGHSHLYIDKIVDIEEWLEVLIALRNAGVLEHGYVGASIQRGYTAVRLPWILKESGPDAMVG